MGRGFRNGLCLLALLLLAACGGGGGRGAANFGAGVGVAAPVECAPYARQVTGFALSGDAADWWGEAAGRYARAASPVPGAALVFRRSGRLPSGHVSVVTRVLSPREILVTQANWVHHRITRDEPVIDVSPWNDWSAVRVWWAPAGQMGGSVYRTYGFILPRTAGARMAGSVATPSSGGS